MADIMTPARGESVSEATVARWTKKVGDPVKKDEVLVELDTDKVSLEVSAPSDGALEAINAGEGDTITAGPALGTSSGGGPAASPPAAPAPAPRAEAPPAPAPKPEPAPAPAAAPAPAPAPAPA